MRRCLYRWQRFFLTILAVLFLSTACYNQHTKNTDLSRSKLAATECRIVQHLQGETCIPLNPQRIVTLDEIMLEILLALDTKPVATTEPNIVGSKVLAFKEKTTGIVSLGKETQPNVERMIQLHPSLILGFGISQRDYQLFSQIAPTISIEYIQTGWKDALTKVGEILGKQQQAQGAIAQYEKRVAQFRKAVERRGKREISVSRFYAGWNLTEFRTKFSFPVSVLQEVGLSVPEVQLQLSQDPNQTFVQLSLENANLLDAGTLFVALDPGAEESFKKYQMSPVWQLLDVVKTNQVYPVDSSYWIFGNVLSANAILDDLSRYVFQDLSAQEGTETAHGTRSSP